MTDPSKRFETPPEWVSQAQSIGEAQSNAAKETDQKPEAVENALNIGEQFFAEFENSASAVPAMDATSAWLRSLDEEEAEQSSAAAQEIPQWLDESQPEPVQLRPSEIPEWLSDSRQPENSDGQFEFAKQKADEKKADLPNWDDIEKNVTPQIQFDAPITPENDLANWLNGLDDEPGLPFDGMTSPDEILFASKPTVPAAKQAEPHTQKPDLPTWLSNDHAQEEEEEADEWIKSIEEEAVMPITAEAKVEEESLPDWLLAIDEETTMTDEGDTPPWRHREQWETEKPEPAMPTQPSDWHPLEPKAATPQPESEPVVQHKPTSVDSFAPPPPQPVNLQPVAQKQMPPVEPPARKKKPEPVARKTQTEAPNAVLALNQAKNELDRGDIPAALTHYSKLIKKGKHLEETIRDLTESIYRYPVEVGIWQTLGDAYMRANRLKEALEAYNKAEELIR